jgi:branched-chain amino acid transport system substrate-binding protein
MACTTQGEQLRGRRPTTTRSRHRVAVLCVGVGLALVASACVERVEVVQGGGGSTGDLAAPTTAACTNPDGTIPGDADPVLDQYRCRTMPFFGDTIPAPTKAGTGEPLRVGMINQENTPLGSFPEIRLGAKAAVDWINAELGGVDGRPIELVPCITTFSPETSRSCAQQLVNDGVVAVLGGIDITSNGSLPVLEQNQLAYVGGVPVNFDEMQSPVSFQFSGGIGGAMAAFAHHAGTTGAKKVAIAYADYGSIKAGALDAGEKVLRDAGVSDVVTIPFPVTGTDFLPVITKAAEGNPAAIFIAGADSACAPAMKTAHDLGVTAQLYLVGACAAPGIGDEIGIDAVEGRIFNVEGPASADGFEGQLYFAVAKRYGDPQLAAASAATVAFRGMMNLWSILAERGPDVTPDQVIESLRSARDRPSFDGHPYTCDGQQLPNLPSMCAPQQVLVQRRGDTLVAITDWIDVPALLRS